MSSDDGEIAVLAVTKRKRRGDTLTTEEFAERQARRAIKQEDAKDDEMHSNVEVVPPEADSPNKDGKKRKKDDERPEFRKVNRYMSNLKSLETISFEKAKQLIKANPHCGLKQVRERRHMALPFHLLGGNVQKSFDYITKQSLGKFRREVSGVVLSLGSVKQQENPRIIDDQGVFHAYAIVTQIVFRPIVKHVYECRVTHISINFVAGLMLDSISVSMPADDKMRENLKGVVLEIGDVVEMRYESMTVNRALCQLRGQFVKVLKKGVKEEKKPEMSVTVPNAAVKKITFADSDDDSE